MDSREQGDSVPGHVQSFDPTEDIWSGVSDFESGYRLGYDGGYGVGAVFGFVIGAGLLLALWAIFK